MSEVEVIKLFYEYDKQKYKKVFFIIIIAASEKQIQFVSRKLHGNQGSMQTDQFI